MPSVGKHGEGSRPIQRKDGRWQVSITLEGGRRVYRYGATEDEAQRKLDELRRLRAEDLEPSTLTLAAFLRSWLTTLRNAKRKRVRARTLEHYNMIAELHIIPALGGRPLSRLSERRIQAWLDADEGSPRTIHHHHAVLLRSLNVALRQRLIPRNPAIGVELPDPRRDVGRPLSAAEVRRLYEATADDWLGPLWRLAVATGLREGELLGLAWDDVDLDQGVIVVANQLQRLEGSWVLVPPKVARTVEQLAISDAAVAALRRHRERQAAARTPGWRYFGLVFVRPNGEPYHRTEILRAFHAACDKAGIARRRFHDLRYTADTLMAEAGVEEHVRMARLGHLTTRMSRRYTKVREVLDRDAAERGERVVGS